jgi:hypothetical protein
MLIIAAGTVAEAEGDVVGPINVGILCSDVLPSRQEMVVRLKQGLGAEEDRGWVDAGDSI